MRNVQNEMVLMLMVHSEEFMLTVNYVYSQLSAINYGIHHIKSRNMKSESVT